MVPVHHWPCLDLLKQTLKPEQMADLGQYTSAGLGISCWERATVFTSINPAPLHPQPLTKTRLELVMDGSLTWRQQSRIQGSREEGVTLRGISDVTGWNMTTSHRLRLGHAGCFPPFPSQRWPVRCYTSLTGPHQVLHMGVNLRDDAVSLKWSSSVSRRIFLSKKNNNDGRAIGSCCLVFSCIFIFSFLLINCAHDLCPEDRKKTRKGDEKSSFGLRAASPPVSAHIPQLDLDSRKYFSHLTVERPSKCWPNG